MIKLFWNTHNQKKTITADKFITQREAVNFEWGIYHKKNSDAWVKEILKKIKYEVVENYNNLKKKIF